MILFFKSGSHIAKVKIEGNEVFFAGDRFGLDNFKHMNPQMNEQEKNKWNNSTKEQRITEVIKDFKKHGFKLIHKE